MPVPSPMPSVPRRRKHTQSALTCSNIILANEDTASAVVLHSAPDSNQATIAFHQTRQRLIREQVRGELMMVQHNPEARILLREPLGTAAVP